MHINDEKRNEIIELLEYNQPLFKALGDIERQRIIILLAKYEKISVTELASKTKLKRPAVSHHLRILKEAGLLRDTREGVYRYYHPMFSNAFESMQILINKLGKVKELL